MPRKNVVIVVNAPSQAPTAGLSQLNRVGRVVSPARPQGYSANLNLGVRELPPGLAFFLLANDDLVFESSSLTELLIMLDADTRTGLVGPALLNPEGRRAWAYRPDPSALLSLLDVALLPLGKAWTPLSRRAGYVDADEFDKDDVKGWIQGAVMLVRSTAYRSVGGFDEAFFFYFEETDFCYRLRSAGWKIRYAPKVSVIHLVGRSSADPRFQRVLLQGRYTYLRKRLGPARMALLQVAQLAVFLLSCGYHGAAATIKPKSCRYRLSMLRAHYRGDRLFFLGPKIQS
jgi:GT2 family glycosyltransferase